MSLLCVSVFYITEHSDQPHGTAHQVRDNSLGVQDNYDHMCVPDSEASIYSEEIVVVYVAFLTECQSVLFGMAVGPSSSICEL